MRAKLIEESIEFQRGKNSKKALHLGGLVPADIFNEIEREAWDKWIEIQRSLIGKKIHFKGITPNPNEHHSYLSVEKDILVKDTTSRAFFSEFGVQDAADNTWYTVTPKHKIFIL